jgi:DNA-binding transcriptional LysR family regulator
LDAIEEAESDIGELTQNPKVLLRVSVSMDFGLSHLVPLLGCFGRLYPNIELDIDFSDKHVDMTESGIDLAIRGGDLGEISLSHVHCAISKDLFVHHQIIS